MIAQTEEQAIGEVSRRLEVRFPSVPAAMVDAVVSEEYSRFTGPIREFVPLLVERFAGERLTQLVRVAS